MSEGRLDEAMQPLAQAVLPPGVRSRFVDGVNGLRVHILEAGSDHRTALWF